MKRFNNLFLVCLSTGLLFASDRAFAVPPPDFIMQVASQIGTFFAVGLALTAGIFSIAMQFVRGTLLDRRKRFWIVSGAVILAIAAIGAFSYDQYSQNREKEKQNAQWLQGVPVPTSANPEAEKLPESSVPDTVPESRPTVPSAGSGAPVSLGRYWES
jgi:hypothetical protein